MIKLDDISFVKDSEGIKAVIISIEEYERLKKMVVKLKEEFEKIMNELKQDSYKDCMNKKDQNECDTE